ncbi:peptidyl-tRNA hydrolase domain-containing protein 1 [Dimargaris verticillata]|uniref:peptidyl-tRNA hydrolase n=1 Tax=Dimargaris verticillata TaxID=2761393 RepID=A0A9W8B5X2_9FUNG|nr:peptidyl-tRNA hydrolase domain-containing protein 1 [Dimargaris verticillata]
MTQACHATSAALCKFRHEPNVQQYTKNLESMHKVVLETKNQASLLKVAEGLTQSQISHYLWVEQPENLETCLATIPVPRSSVRDILKKCQLWR